MGIVAVEVLQDALQKSWSADTSKSSGWNEHDRARGQCAVTACVVQDYLGGEILNTVATLPTGEKVSHYFNVINGETIDLTEQQFPCGTRFTDPAPKTKGARSTRDYCLSNEDTKDRYRLLSARIASRVGMGA
ncbi:hypothetical protein ACIP5Y_28740 [Nocardia sp. NPDC088792]|uniref:YunG family protein n=1 Tax=Nocardia sp. NPDC088792 TaxID=3364332 RepID=UPI00381BADD6